MLFRYSQLCGTASDAVDAVKSAISIHNILKKANMSDNTPCVLTIFYIDKLYRMCHLSAHVYK